MKKPRKTAFLSESEGIRTLDLRLKRPKPLSLVFDLYVLMGVFIRLIQEPYINGTATLHQPDRKPE